MDYPLAHDENGSPLDVPATATGWLVRRHAGGRGRPGAVYDNDGRPLVVALESTAAELRSCGCHPATYRLDAVDSERRQLGVTAYTEVRRGSYSFDEDEDGGAPSSTGEAAVAALARAVEAMQRVQAERERAQAERERAQADMLARLIERLAPPPPPPTPRNMPDVLREYGDVQKIIKKLAPEPDDEAESGGGSVMEMIAQVIEQVAGAVLPVLQVKMAGDATAQTSTEAETASDLDDTPEEQETREEEQSRPDGPAEPDLDAKIDAVFSLLTREEAKLVQKLSLQMPQALLDKAMAQLLAMSAEDAAAELRRQLAKFGFKPAAKKAPANGKATTGDAAEATATEASEGASKGAAA